MGLGDVKFMAAIGTFLGWKAVIFSLMLSSLIGSFVGVTLIVIGKHAWSLRSSYGPTGLTSFGEASREEDGGRSLNSRLRSLCALGSARQGNYPIS